MNQNDFDRLAIFVAVVDELSKEPFFSPDCHESLSNVGGVFTGKFSHPMFLKSALQPFRRLWMVQESSSFSGGTLGKKKYLGIRDLIHNWSMANELLGDYSIKSRLLIYESSFDDRLKKAPIIESPICLSRKEIIDLWIYTQAAHGGKAAKRKKFDDMTEKIGREIFEFAFRICIREIGSIYMDFANRLAVPLFEHLKNERGLRPCFEAEFRLRHNPYADSRHRIVYEDVFWHIDKETIVETYARLQARHRFNSLTSLLHELFPMQSVGANTVMHYKTFSELLLASGVTRVPEDAPPLKNCTLKLQCRNCLTGRYEDRVEFDVFKMNDVQSDAVAFVRFAGNTEQIIEQLFLEFRTLFISERQVKNRRF